MNETSTITSLRMCTCDHHNISIIAINRCGRASPSTPNITLDKEPKKLNKFQCSAIDSNDCPIEAVSSSYYYHCNCKLLRYYFPANALYFPFKSDTKIAMIIMAIPVIIAMIILM